MCKLANYESVLLLCREETEKATHSSGVWFASNTCTYCFLHEPQTSCILPLSYFPASMHIISVGKQQFLSYSLHSISRLLCFWYVILAPNHAVPDDRANTNSTSCLCGGCILKWSFTLQWSLNQGWLGGPGGERIWTDEVRVDFVGYWPCKCPVIKIINLYCTFLNNFTKCCTKAEIETR